MDTTSIQDELNRIVPVEYQAHIPDLTSILKSIIDKSISVESAKAHISSSPQLSSLIKLLADQRISADQAVISFGKNNQLGEVTIESVAGRDIVKIETLSLSNQNTPFQLVCKNCGTVNSHNSKFCVGCSKPLVRTCPECNQETSWISSSICTNCGYHYETATRRVQLRKQLSDLETSVNTLTGKLEKTKFSIENLKLPSSGGPTPSYIFIIAGLLTVIYSASTVIIGVFSTSISRMSLHEWYNNGNILLGLGGIIIIGIGLFTNWYDRSSQETERTKYQKDYHELNNSLQWNQQLLTSMKEQLKQTQEEYTRTNNSLS